MSRRTRVSLWILAAAVFATGATLAIRALRSHRPTLLVGAVLIQDTDPRKQTPIPNVKIIAIDGDVIAETVSDSNGFFRMDLPRAPWEKPDVRLEFRHQDYKSVDMTWTLANRLCIVRMAALAAAPPAESSGPETVLSDVRVRYAMKNLTAVNIGSMARAFEVANLANVPCNHAPHCSPDGKWRANLGSESFDAGEGHQFSNTRLSCIAGPCPFTKVISNAPSRDGRIVRVSVLNWSDTTTFLFEAEVIQTMPNEAIRQLYPAIFGRSMNFTLPAGAQGPSLEADVNGSTIVFPLGPGLKLSWAECNLNVSPDKTKLYSCELKSGYRFR